MKKFLGTSLLILAAYGTAASADTVRYTCQQTASDKVLCDWYDQRFEELTGHKAERVDWPWQSDQQLSILQQQFAAKSGDIDVIMVDVVWPGMMASNLLDLSPYVTEEERAQHIPVYINNNTVGGEFKAIPYLMDTGLMFYRTDLLEKYGKEVPTTWEELTATAKEIMDAERAEGNDKMWGFVFQGKAYEGLTCDALEWVSSFNGGDIVDAEGNITVNNPNAAAALDMAGAWVGTIAPEGVLSYTEEESRQLFQAGNSVFHRNWTYVWAKSNEDDSPVKGKVGLAPNPHGPDGKSASTLGGWSFAVNKYSKIPDAAVAFAKFASSEEAQLKRYELVGNWPTLPALYEKPELAEAKKFLPIFEAAVVRPSTPTKAQYNRVSNEFWNAAFSVLSGKNDGTKAVADLEKRLDRVKKGGWE